MNNSVGMFLVLCDMCLRSVESYLHDGASKTKVIGTGKDVSFCFQTENIHKCKI